MFSTIYETHFSRAYSRTGFSASFGVSVEICDWLWTHIDDKKTKPIYLLMTLSFLKSYPTFEVLSASFRVSERTCRTWVWNVLDQLSESLDEVSQTTQKEEAKNKKQETKNNKTTKQQNNKTTNHCIRFMHTKDSGKPRLRDC